LAKALFKQITDRRRTDTTQRSILSRSGRNLGDIEGRERNA
jgi:hypothetical protein